MTGDLDHALRTAVERFRAGDLPAAKSACEEVLKQTSRNPLALNLMALIARSAKKWGKAEEIAAAGFQANPAYPDLVNTLGLVLLDQRRWGEASAAFVKALDLDPRSPLYLSNFARAEMGRGNLQAAEQAFAQAIDENPTFVAALTGRASLLIQTDRLDDAAKDLSVASAASANNPEVLATHAVLKLAAGDLESAYTLFDQVSTVSPDVADAAVNRGLIRLLQGRLSDGWEDYALRRKRRWARAFGRHESIPPWNGDSLTGASLLVWCEQGLGESILGASQLDAVLAEARHVSIECDPRLVDLFRRSFPAADVMLRSDPPDQRISEQTIDLQTSVFDLIGHRAEDIAQRAPRAPFLKADADQAAELRRKYCEALGVERLIGLSWESPKALTAGQKRVDPDLWAPLLASKDVGFVNVQYGSASGTMDALAQVCSAAWLEDPDIDPSGDLDRFAAQLAALDLVITVSNTTAHLAGALGTETWVIVPPLGTASMWYWFIDRSDSPWYSTARMFRRVHGEDIEVFRRMAAELAKTA
jgi:tetratricopeptide (TPR) repeat protein